MNPTNKSVDELLNLAKERSPLLTDERAEELLHDADKRKRLRLSVILLHFIATFFDGYVGIAAAAIGIAVGVMSTLLYINEGKSLVVASHFAQQLGSQSQSTTPVATAPSNSQNTVVSSPIVIRSVPIAAAPHMGSGIVSHRALPIALADTSARAQSPQTTISELSITAVDLAHGKPLPLANIDGDLSGDASHSSTRLPLGLPFDVEHVSFEGFGLSVFVESGSSYAALRGGLRNTFNSADLTVPQNFGTSTGGWGMYTAAGVALRTSSWMRVSAALRLTQLATTYSSPDVIFVPTQPNSTLTSDVHVQHNAALTIGEIAVEPSVRIQPIGSPLFMDAGLAIGYLYHQALTYSTSVTSIPDGVNFDAAQIPAPTQSTIASGRTQFDVKIGLGTSVSLGNTLRIDAKICGEYGLVPLFADNYPRRLSITPVIGVEYLVP